MPMQSWPVLERCRARWPRTAACRTRVGEDEQRVLAAQFHGAVLEARGGLRGDDAPGRRRAGEHEVVGGFDQRLAELAAASGHDLEQVARQACLGQERLGPERRVRRLAVGFEDDGVAGEQCGDDVTGREGQRVVPRGDDADHAARVVQFAGAREDRQCALPAARSEEALGRVRVVARRIAVSRTSS